MKRETMYTSSNSVHKVRNKLIGSERLALFMVALRLAYPLTTQGQYTCTTNNGCLTIMHYNGPGGGVTIPGTINGLAVTGIGAQAFAYSPALTSIDISDNITDIGTAAFSDCINLTNVVMPKTVLNIGEKAFCNCAHLTDVLLPNAVTNIGAQAFYGCSSLRDVSLPGTVTSIGTEAFSWCISLASVFIPAGVTNVGEFAFHACSSLSVIDVDAQNPLYSSLAGVLFDKDRTVLLQCPGGKSGTYVIPNGVTRIAEAAFVNCNSLTNISIPNNVTNIGASAFSLAASLYAITVDPLNSFYSSMAGALFDKQQTTLLQCASGISGEFALPQSVTNVLTTAFIGCKNLSAIRVDDLNGYFTSLGGVLLSKDQATLIQCPAGLTGSYMVPQGVKQIRDYAFVSCSGLTKISLPGTVQEIGLAAFSGCSGVTEMRVPDSVTIIGAEAFEDCTGLSAVVIGNSVTNLGACAFYQCMNLSSLSLPASLTTIADRAFESCGSLNTVTLGENVSSIGSLAFGFCTNLTSIYFKGNAPALDAVALGEGNTTVYFLPGTTGWQTNCGGLPALLWEARVQTRSPTDLNARTNGFGFTIIGTSNIFVVIEVSTNLAGSKWYPVQTNRLIGGQALFDDPQWSNCPARFYQIRSP